MLKIVSSLGLCALLFACDPRTPGTVSIVREPGPPAPGPQGRLIETFADPLFVYAGASVTVNCVVRRDGTFLSSEEAQIVLTPDVPEVLSLGRRTLRFTPKAAADYWIQCQTADGEVMDTDGVHVRVLPGPVYNVDTEIENPDAMAGAPILVNCLIQDSFGNTIDALDATHIEASPEILIDGGAVSPRRVRGTKAGDFEVACANSGVVDPTPAIVHITPGIPGSSETLVDNANPTPTQPAHISCAVADEFGNALSGIATILTIIPSENINSANGFTLLGNTFTSTVTGDFYAFCAVPGYYAGDETPAIISVQPGLPCNWTVEVGDSPCFPQNRRLPIDYEVRDCWDNRIVAPNLTIESTPAGILSNDQGGFIAQSEGDFSIILNVAGPHDPAGAIAPFIKNFRIDSTGPQVTMSPSRGAMLLQGGYGTSSVNVTGTVTDSFSPIVSISIDGQSLAVGGNSLSEAFAASVDTHWGLNIIDAVVEDTCGNFTLYSQSLMRSPAYYPATVVNNPSARVSRGAIGHFNQNVLDDSNRSTIDDMATIAEQVALDFDLNSLFPAGFVIASDPLRSGCSFPNSWADYSYDITRGAASIQITGPRIQSLNAVDGGIGYDVRATDIVYPVRIVASYKVCTLGVAATIGPITMDASPGAQQVTASGSLGLNLVGGVPSASLPNSNLSTQNFFVGVDCGPLPQWLCDDVLEPVIASTVQSLVEGALRNLIADELPGAVQNFFSDFSLDTSFDLPSPFNVSLNMDSGFDDMFFCGPAAGLSKPLGCPVASPSPGYGRTSFAAQIFPSSRGPTIPSNSFGSIRRGGALPIFSATGYEFGVGLKDDLLNQILWAVWYGGGLHLPDLGSTLTDLGFDGVQMSFDALLPPVIMPGTNGFDIDIGIGDAFVQATVDINTALGISTPAIEPIFVSFYMSAIMGGSFDIDSVDNTLTMQINPAAAVYAQVTELNDIAYQGALSLFFTELARLLIPSLLSNVIGAFPLPEFDISSVPGVPPETSLKLIGSDATRSNDYYLFTGALQ